jgi:hypothetical protein
VQGPFSPNPNSWSLKASLVQVKGFTDPKRQLISASGLFNEKPSSNSGLLIGVSIAFEGWLILVV